MDFSALVWCPVGSKLLDTFGKQTDKHKHPMPTDKDDKHRNKNVVFTQMKVLFSQWHEGLSPKICLCNN